MSTKLNASVATPAEPRKNKVMTLRKFNCLNEVSFEFLGMDLFFLGNLTKSGSKPLQELFGTFLRRKKYEKLNLK